MYILSNLSKAGYKALSGFIATTSLISMFGVMPVQAEETNNTGDLTATISGNTLGNTINSIRSTTCEGEQQLSGTDAEVFKNVVPESDGEIICAKSDGFRTEVTGTSDIKNFHWTAWYKKNKDDKPDASNDIGNYYGFNSSKVKDWQPYSDEIKGLNNGAFPEEKDYTYPVDTKENKLDFWGDIAGYYDVLGDPQYKAIHLTSYQQFSYKTKHEVVEWIPVEDEDNTNNDNIGSGGGGGGGGGKIEDEPETEDPLPSTPPTYCRGDSKRQNQTGQCYSNRNQCEYDMGHHECFEVDLNKTSYRQKSPNNSQLQSNELLAKKKKTKKEDPVVEGIEEKNGITMKKQVTYTYTDESQEVKVAEADLSSGVYATEYAAIPRLSLTAGSGSTNELKVNNNGFWKTTPRYWTDKGTITVTNKSDMPYHYESELTAGEGVNNVNVYANLIQKDKLYTLIHGYPNVTDVKIPGVDGTPRFPKNPDETCVEVDNDAVCSKKQTAIVRFEIKLEEDKIQQLEEADKTVHLVKNQETQDVLNEAKDNQNK